MYPPPPTRRVSSVSLHDALPIFTEVGTYKVTSKVLGGTPGWKVNFSQASGDTIIVKAGALDALPTARKIGKSTRLNSSHGYISYAVFCLKKTNILLSDI